jgi:hypothetical protein
MTSSPFKAVTSVVPLSLCPAQQPMGQGIGVMSGRVRLLCLVLVDKRRDTSTATAAGGASV